MGFQCFRSLCLLAASDCVWVGYTEKLLQHFSVVFSVHFVHLLSLPRVWRMCGHRPHLFETKDIWWRHCGWDVEPMEWRYVFAPLLSLGVHFTSQTLSLFACPHLGQGKSGKKITVLLGKSYSYCRVPTWPALMYHEAAISIKGFPPAFCSVTITVFW